MSYVGQSILDYAGTFPVPVPVYVPIEIHQDRFDITSRADLAEEPTTMLAVGTVFNLIIGSGTSRTASVVELQAGPAIPADTSHVAPNDYNPATNNKHWAVVLGYLP